MSSNDSVQPYASESLRAGCVMSLLGIGVVLQLIGTGVAASAIETGADLISKIEAAKADVSGYKRQLLAIEVKEEVAAYDSKLRTIEAVAVYQLWVFVATVVLFLMWIHRAHRNLPALGARGLKYSPGWAVGWWFVPVMAYFRPYQVVKEIWRASDPDVTDGFSWQKAPAWPLLGWWWASWLIANFIPFIVSVIAGIVSVIAGASMHPAVVAPIFDPVLVVSHVALVTEVAYIVTSSLALLVVADIHVRQRERSQRVAALAAPPPPSHP